MSRALRAYQREAVDCVRTEWERGIVRTSLVAATGLGKTDVIAYIAVREVQRGGRVLILAHRDELLDQLMERCRTWARELGANCSVGRVQGQVNETRRHIVAASVMTVAKPARQQLMVKPALVIVDEAHHAASKGYRAVLDWAGCYRDQTPEYGPNGELLPPTRAFGVTATMVRGDKKSLGDVWQSVALELGIQWGVEHGPNGPVREGEQGWLVRPFGRCVVTDHMELEKAKIRRGDFGDTELGGMVEQDVEQIVTAWLEHASDRITMAFTPTIAAATALRDAFLARDVKAEMVLGTTPGSERRAVKERMETGVTRVRVDVGVGTEGFDCLDDETEILTAAGWRGMGQVAVGDIVHALNRETGLLEAVPVTRYVERPMRDGERMFTIQSQHVNIRTSEGHQFHVGTRKSKQLKTFTGTELAQRRSLYSLPLAVPSAEPFEGLYLTDDEIRFVAWFMTDGGFNGASTVEISQAKDHKDDIRALLTRLGMDFTERVRQPDRAAFPNAKPLHVFSVPRGVRGGLYRRVGWDGLAQYLDKDVPSILHRMTRDQFLVFWAELLKGDGAHAWLWCDRQSQADAYTMMASLRGLSSSYSTISRPGRRTMFLVSVRDRQWIHSYPPDSRSAKMRLEEPRPGEKVWCVTNHLSTLVTRRHGKIVIIGNCPAISCILMARPTRLPGFYAQMVGRGLRPFAGNDHLPAKHDCMVLDVVGASRYVKLQTLVDLLPSAAKDYDRSEVDAIPCPDCGMVGRCPCEAAEPRAKAKLIHAEYEDIELFASSPVRWLATPGGTRFIKAGDWLVHLDPEPGGGWTVAQCRAAGDQSMGSYRAHGLTLEQASAMAEKLAERFDPKIRTPYKGDGKATPAAVAYAKAYGIEGAERMTGRACSDAISIAQASKRLD